jgi:superfamily II DNA/RNA helicase
VDALRKGPALLVATPGRLLDLIDAGHVSLTSVRAIVLDEADKMLNLGFAPQLERLRAMLLPADDSSAAGAGKKQKKKGKDKAVAAAAANGEAAGGGGGRPQVLLFTATMPKEVESVVGAWLGPSAVRVRTAPSAESISTTIAQARPGGAGAKGRGAPRLHFALAAAPAGLHTPWRPAPPPGGPSTCSIPTRPHPNPCPNTLTPQVVHVCAEHKKPAKLLKHLAAVKAAAAGARNPPRVLVFANRVKTVKFLVGALTKEGWRVEALHGQRSQAEREAAVAGFRWALGAGGGAAVEALSRGLVRGAARERARCTRLPPPPHPPRAPPATPRPRPGPARCR